MRNCAENKVVLRFERAIFQLYSHLIYKTLIFIKRPFRTFVTRPTRGSDLKGQLMALSAIVTATTPSIKNRTSHPRRFSKWD